MKSFLKWAIALIAVTPLAMANNALFPYVAGKTVFLRGALFVVAAVFAYLFLADRDFKREVSARLAALWKQPLVKMVALSWVLLCFSTIFAYDRSMAFFGTIERGEGFLGLTSFYLFFFFAISAFEKKDWLRFFSVSLVVGWLSFIYELIQAFGGMARPYSFLGNPIYLAVYFLFTLFASLVIARENTKGSFWRIAGIVTAAMSVVGIFVTESRGVLVGMAAGLLLALAAFVWFSRRAGTAKRKTSQVIVSILVLCIAFGGAFAATRKDSFWQHVPGLNRIAAYSLSDGNTQARIINTEISLTALDPKNESLKTMLLGWGWDNYLFAWQKYYRPALYGFDTGLFDRPHDKLLDQLVMTGLLGFLAYLALWFFFLREAVREGRRSPYVGALIVFWAVAYFLQNLSAFDTVVTFVIFFAMVGYVISLRDAKGEAHAGGSGAGVPLAIAFVAMAVFSGVAFIAWTLIPEWQMAHYTQAMKDEFVHPSEILTDSFIFSPTTYAAQGAIRENMLTLLLQQYDDGTISSPSPALDLSLKELRSYADAHPDEYEYLMLVGKGYDAEANLTSDPSLFKTAEAYYEKAQALAPNRQEGVYLLAINLLNQGMTQDGVKLLEGAVALDPEIPSNHFELAQAYVALGTSYYDKSFTQFEIALSQGVDLNQSLAKKSYEQFLTYYYGKGDFADTLAVVKRLVTLDPSQSVYPELVQYMEANHSIPYINFGGTN